MWQSAMSSLQPAEGNDMCSLHSLNARTISCTDEQKFKYCSSSRFVDVASINLVLSLI